MMCMLPWPPRPSSGRHDATGDTPLGRAAGWTRTARAVRPAARDRRTASAVDRPLAVRSSRPSIGSASEQAPSLYRRRAAVQLRAAAWAGHSTPVDILPSPSGLPRLARVEGVRGAP
jgi:hypothetical protein